MQEKDSSEETKATGAAREAVRGSVFLFVGNTFSIAVSSVASIVIARLLGPSNYGLYSVTLAVPYLMLLFTDFGVNPALVRFAAKLRSERRSRLIANLIRSGVCFELVTAILIVMISIFLADILALHVVNRPDAAFLIRIASFTVLGSALLATSSSVFVGLDEMDKAATLSILNSIIKLIAAPTLIVLGFGVAGAVTGHVSGVVIAGVLGSLFVLRIRENPEYRPDIYSGLLSNLTPMVRYGMPLYASTLMGGILNQYHAIVLPWFTSNVEIGNYSIATVFSAGVALLMTPISTALFPAFSKFDPTGSLRELKVFFLQSLRYTFLLIVPASFFIALSSEDLVSLFYGMEYVQAPLYLRLYSMTFLLAGFSLVLTSFFNGVGRTNVPFRATLIHLCVAIPFSLLFTSFYGVIGLISAAIVSAMLPIAYMAWRARYEYGLGIGTKRFIRTFIASLLSSVPTLASIALAHSHAIRLVLAAFVFGATCLTIAPILRVIEHEDVANLRKISENTGWASHILLLVLSYEEKVLRALYHRSVNGRHA